MNPEVSVIMPNYNKGRYLRWAIKSVLEQTIDDIELVVVDDASNDNSLMIVKELQKEDGRILLRLNAENLGVATSRNVGLKASSAKVVTFIDSDDLFSKDSIERQLQIINSRDKQVVVYSDPIRIGPNSSSVESVETKYSFRPSGWIFPDLITARFSFRGATITLPRSCFDAVGLFDESLRWGEDLEMCLRLARKYEFSYYPVATYGYRAYEGNVIQTMTRADRYRYQGRIIESHLFTNSEELDRQTRQSAFNVLFSCYVASGQWSRILRCGFSSEAGFRSLMTLPFRAVLS